MFAKLTRSPIFHAFAIAMIIAVLFVLPVLAQDGAPATPDLSGSLKALATGGAAALVAVLFSWLGSQWPAFNAQKPVAKWLEQVGASAVLGIGAFYLVTYQSTLITQLEPWFVALALAVGPLLLNQAWHALVNKSA